jgi:hypothetical protein
VRIPTGKSAARAFIVRKGFATVALDPLSADTTVVLRPLPLRVALIRLSGVPPLPDPELRMSAELLWCGPPGTALDAVPDLRGPRRPLVATSLEDDEGAFTCSVWEPGVYAVRIWVRHGSRRGMAVDLSEEPRLSVSTAGPVGEVVARVDPDRLRLVIEHLLSR